MKSVLLHSPSVIAQTAAQHVEQFAQRDVKTVVAGAIRMAKLMGPGHTIVTVLCDFGTRYQSKMFNPAFLREKGLPVPPWLERHSDILPAFEPTAG